MSHRRIDALRRLAERPGTEAEGMVAREMLKRAEAKQGSDFHDYEAEYAAVYSAFARGEVGMDVFIAATRKHNDWVVRNLPTTRKCDCGAVCQTSEKCGNQWRHLEIQTEIRAKFAKGDRVYYNRWAYPANCPGRVAAYVKLKPGIPQWAWLSVKFDHLKSARQCPVFSALGWHLTHGPVDAETLLQTGVREGMERMERMEEVLR